MAANQEPTILEKVKNLALGTSTCFLCSHEGDKGTDPAAPQPKKDKKEKKAGGTSSLEVLLSL
jgi:hypothetical protein